MKKLLLILLCVPLMFSCGDTNNPQTNITHQMLVEGYTGQGTYTYDNGDKYEGEWKVGTKNGQGTYTCAASGNKYIGEWKDNQRHGQGTLTYDNGDIYVGEFKDDKEDGKGTYTWSGGNKYC